MSRKKYSINWEDELAVSFEVDGVQYETLDDVPDDADRRRLEAMLDSSIEAEFDDPEFAEMRKETQQIGGASFEKLIVGIFTGVAVLMLMIAAVSAFFNIQRLGREESAPGVVVEMVQRRHVDEQTGNVDINYFPVVSFTAQDGKLRTIELTEGGNPPPYEAGDEVTILYEPDNPSDARIKSAGSFALMWILPGVTGTVGVSFLIAVFAVRKYLFPEPTDSQLISSQ